jgi:hypothetical protein
MISRRRRATTGFITFENFRSTFPSQGLRLKEVSQKVGALNFEVIVLEESVQIP